MGPAYWCGDTYFQGFIGSVVLGTFSVVEMRGEVHGKDDEKGAE